jgi:hypothetical protein
VPRGRGLGVGRLGQSTAYRTRCASALLPLLPLSPALPRGRTAPGAVAHGLGRAALRSLEDRSQGAAVPRVWVAAHRVWAGIVHDAIKLACSRGAGVMSCRSGPRGQGAVRRRGKGAASCAGAAAGTLQPSFPAVWRRTERCWGHTPAAWRRNAWPLRACGAWTVQHSARGCGNTARPLRRAPHLPPGAARAVLPLRKASNETSVSVLFAPCCRGPRGRRSAKVVQQDDFPAGAFTFQRVTMESRM